MKNYRVRIRKLPWGNFAIECRRWPWSFWEEESTYHYRESNEEEAIKRAQFLLTGGEIIPHSTIASYRGEAA